MDDDKAQGWNSSEAKTWLTVIQAADLLGITERAVRKNCAAGKYRVDTIQANGGEQYRILLSSLPVSAIANYYREQAHNEGITPESERARVEEYNGLIKREQREAAAAGLPAPKGRLLPVPMNEQERSEAWEGWDQVPESAQDEATRRLNILKLFQRLQREGVPVGAIEKEIKASHGVSAPTLHRWRERVRGQDEGDWLPLLLPNWKPRTAKAEFTEEAWEFIRERWGNLSQPSAADCYRRAMAIAAEQGWKIPSLDVVERRLKALPRWWRKYRREGEKALAATFPHQLRDYTQLRVHDIWCADGRKADVFCAWTNPDGSQTIGRPIILGWLDVRTRYVLGIAVGRTESADLVRLAFKKALDTAHVIPEEALMDNGRGFASKLLTGGAPRRFRFKVKDDDIEGIFTALGIVPIWATPGHGQAKPIESFWRTLADTDKRAEFAGSYCGNRPDAKPEDFDAKKAVPIEVYTQAVLEDIGAYHHRAHRGDGMNGRSPFQAYEEFLPQAPARKQPTAQQARLCLLAAEGIKLDKNSSIWLLGNRYWHEKLVDLDEARTYTVRFNPEDAAEPVAVYDGSRFVCEAALKDKTGFRDQEAAKEHAREQRRYTKSKKQQADALGKMHRARQWTPKEDGETKGREPGETQPFTKLPVPKVAEPLRVDMETPRADPPQEAPGNGKRLGLVVAALRKYGGNQP